LADDSTTKRETAAGRTSAADTIVSALARRPDFQLGSATVRPSIRTVNGPGGSLTTEPRVMQVLLAFADAGGAVLTRDDLMRICWSGMIVGDDAISRAVAEVRRIARATGAGFGIETIPRIGYRLTGGAPAGVGPASEPEAVPAPIDTTPEPVDSIPERATRRWVIGGALAATGAAAVGIWAAYRPRSDPRYVELLDRGRQALRMSVPGIKTQGVEFFQEAVTIRPDDASAWGLLALAKSNVADASPSQVAGVAVQESEQAARRALALNEKEPNALIALAMLQRKLDDWLTTDRKLRAVLAIAPENIAALDNLVSLLQASGYYQESWDVNEQAIAFDALRPTVQYRRALKLWIMGRPLEADQAIARARELWPLHPQVWNARLLISAFTGQIQAARILVKDQPTTSQMISPTGVATWEVSLTALETRDPGDIASARAANLSAAPQSRGLAVHAILILAALQEVDATYSIINGLLLRRGGLVTQVDSGQGPSPASDPLWRQTQWLFTPATRSLRTDPRFVSLCDDIGLSKYWSGRGIVPDEGLPHR
jgi:DNA-binding winged helix-turn-helix (wHTH) protein/tetratricopeptide (TPR) repeat protein